VKVSQQVRANDESSLYIKILELGKKVYIAAATDINGVMRRETSRIRRRRFPFIWLS